MATAWREALADYIRTQALPVEKFGHQPRLYALTREIGQGSVYDDDIVYAACWLHDLGVFTGHRPEAPEELKVWDNTAYAMARTPGLLADFGFPAEKVDAVVEAIRTHQPAFTPSSVEATILRDADLLEQLGAIGALRAVCKIGRDTRFLTFTDAAASLEKALQSLPQRIVLPTAQRLATPRVAALRGFLDAIRDEAGDHLL